MKLVFVSEKLFDTSFDGLQACQVYLNEGRMFPRLVKDVLDGLFSLLTVPADDIDFCIAL